MNTPAPLISMIVKTVYDKCDKGFESERTSHEFSKLRLSVVKSICCLLVDELVNDEDENILTVLHITKSTYSNYIGEIMYQQQRVPETKDMIDLLRVEIILAAINQEKYITHLKQSIIKEKII